MISKKYETSKDLQNEESFISKMQKNYGLVLKKLPMSYSLDFLSFKDGEPYKFIEYKRRHFSYGKYDTVILSAIKYNNAIAMSTSLKLDTQFVVELDDGVYSTKIPLTSLDIRWGGRTKQYRDATDIEPVIHIPMDSFKLMYKKD